jgi:hypothetical protein
MELPYGIARGTVRQQTKESMMLKGYSFAEKQVLARTSISPEILSQQKQVAKAFLAETDVGIKKRKCPACGHEGSTHFGTIMEIEYRLCSDCQSIFASVAKDTASRYAAYPALESLRCSDTFQASSCKSRTDIWYDLLFWIRFRCARYLACNKDLKVVDIDDPYDGLSEMLRNSSLCACYERATTLLAAPVENDLVIYMEQLRKESDPLTTLCTLHSLLKDNSLLFLSARLGSGFDVLALKDNNPSVFPCEHLFLPSSQGLVVLLEKAGFEVLEFLTPGNLDIEYVLQNRELIEEGDLLINQILMVQDTATLLEFQRILQRGGLSSYARLVARRAD